MRTQYLDYPIQVTTPAPGVEAVETAAHGARFIAVTDKGAGVKVYARVTRRSAPDVEFYVGDRDLRESEPTAQHTRAVAILEGLVSTALLPTGRA